MIDSNDLFLRLPFEIQCRIFSFLLDDPTDIGTLLRVSKHVQQTINAWHPWKRLCERRYYEPCLNIKEDQESEETDITETGPRSEENVNRDMRRAWISLSSDEETEDEVSDSERIMQNSVRDMQQQLWLTPSLRDPLVTDQRQDEGAWMDNALSNKDAPANGTSKESSISISDTSVNWKELFVKNWTLETSFSRGQCRVRGADVRFGTSSGMQTFGNKIFGGFNNIISVWDILSGDPVYRLAGHTEAIHCLQVDENQLVSASADCTIKTWDTKHGHLIHSFSLPAVVRALRFNSTEIIAGDSLGSIHIIDYRQGMIRESITGHHTREITHIQFDDRYIVSASADKVLQVYDRLNRCIIFVTDDLGSFITALCLGANIVAAGTWSGRLCVWEQISTPLNKDSTRDELIARAGLAQITVSSNRIDDCHFERINCIQMSPIVGQIPQNGVLQSYPKLFTGANDGALRMWQYQEGAAQYQCMVTMEHEAPVLCLQLNRLHNTPALRVMAAGLDGKLHHWRLTDWQHQESGPSVADTEEGKVIDGYHVRKIGTEMTFASSFLPIVLYQDFIHLLLDQPRRE